MRSLTELARPTNVRRLSAESQYPDLARYDRPDVAAAHEAGLIFEEAKEEAKQGIIRVAAIAYSFDVPHATQCGECRKPARMVGPVVAGLQCGHLTLRSAKRTKESPAPVSYRGRSFESLAAMGAALLAEERYYEELEAYQIQARILELETMQAQLEQEIAEAMQYLAEWDEALKEDAAREYLARRRSV